MGGSRARDFEVMLLDYSLESIHLIVDHTCKVSFNTIEGSMYGFCPLFSHYAKAQMPPTDPGYHVHLQKVHFWQHCSMRECLTVEFHKTLDVLL